MSKHTKFVLNGSWLCYDWRLASFIRQLVWHKRGDADEQRDPEGQRDPGQEAAPSTGGGGQGEWQECKIGALGVVAGITAVITGQGWEALVPHSQEGGGQQGAGGLGQGVRGWGHRGGSPHGP